MPAIVAAAGERAGLRCVEFFTAQIRNPNTRAAYARACGRFLAWCETAGLSLPRIGPLHVAAHVEALGRELRPPSVKQHLAALRMLLDWLVVGQVAPHNPAAAVRGPRYSASRGRTRMPTREEVRALLAAIPAGSLVGPRDRALIGTLLFTFARASAALAMRVEDCHPVGRRWWLRLPEKGGKEHAMPAHHRLQDDLDAYIEAAGIADDPRGPLFRSALGRTGRLTAQAMGRADACRMIGRRARAAGIAARIGCHSWRARGITAYLENRGLLEHAQRMAAHASDNGLGMEGNETSSLVEANMLVEDEAVLASIEGWFDTKVLPRARTIEKDGFKRAKLLWKRNRGKGRLQRGNPSWAGLEKSRKTLMIEI